MTQRHNGWTITCFRLRKLLLLYLQRQNDQRGCKKCKWLCLSNEDVTLLFGSTTQRIDDYVFMTKNVSFIVRPMTKRQKGLQCGSIQLINKDVILWFNDTTEHVFQIKGCYYHRTPDDKSTEGTARCGKVTRDSSPEPPHPPARLRLSSQAAAQRCTAWDAENRYWVCVPRGGPPRRDESGYLRCSIKDKGFLHLSKNCVSWERVQSTSRAFKKPCNKKEILLYVHRVE